jgi:hypothetical protein
MSPALPDDSAFRSEIERALDELIPYEEGMRFQVLAVVLAKQKWPDLIACERKKDLGLDAYTSASLAPDRVGKVLACSISTTIEKVESDARKIQENYPDAKVLIFATPVKITNQTAQGWIDKLREKFGFELVLVTREDIVTSLMNPINVPLCRTHLGMAVAIPAAESEALQKVTEANREVAAAWFSHPRLSGKPLVALQAIRLNQAGDETGDVFSLDGLKSSLAEGRRLVLEAPAGRGKTTTLVQIAQQHIKSGQLALLVDLPEWVRSQQGILEFVARMPQFLARDVSAGTLAKLLRVEHFSFLLNGWNEVSEAQSEGAVLALRQLERNYPAAGIIVTTRTHHIAPPLPGASRLRLLPLNRAQRMEYLRSALGARAEELRLQLEGSRVLDGLTRTPLVLSEVTTLFEAGVPIPNTRAGVLGAVTQLMEQASERRDRLQRPPLTGRAQAYLAELALHMTGLGEVRVLDEEARALCRAASVRLQAANQIEKPPEPADILNSLCAHHVLERLDYPSAAYRFEHQQFQEFYAAGAIFRELQTAVTESDPATIRAFAGMFVNHPTWEQPLCMVAEKIEAQGSDPALLAEAMKAGRGLVEMALPLDPIFAADLCRLCGPIVPAHVRSELGVRLRSWYAVGDGRHRRCALAGMLASGSSEFSDVLLPLLTSDNQQVRLQTYRAWDEFHLSSLGPDWRRIVSGWGEVQRIDFIFEAMRHRWSPEIGEGFGLADPSPEVRSRAVQALSWYGGEESLIRYLESLNNDDFEGALDTLRFEGVPAPLRPRAIASYRRRLPSTSEATDRLRLLLAMASWGDTAAAGTIKSELAQFPVGRVADPVEQLLHSAANILHAVDPAWVSDWVTGRILDGSLWRDRWTSFLSNIPGALQTEIAERFGAEPLQHNVVQGLTRILLAANNPSIVNAAVLRLCDIRRGIADEAPQGNSPQWQLSHQLEHLVRSFPPETLVKGLLGAIGSRVEPVEITVAVDLLGAVGADTANLRDELPDALREGLRAYLLASLPLILQWDDFAGQAKMHLAVALARVGSPEDIQHLGQLIRADIERLRAGRAATSRRERNERTNGAHMCCANWHVDAVIRLDPGAAEAVLLELLSEPEYESEAGKGLIRLVHIHPSAAWGTRSPDYSKMWEARAGRQAAAGDEERSRRYAAAIDGRVAALLGERGASDNQESLNRRLKTLAMLIAALDGRDTAARVFSIMAIPCEWDGWTRVHAVEALFICGAPLPTEETFNVLNPTIEHTLTQGLYNEQNRGLLEHCLCLLAFVEEPSKDRPHQPGSF